MTDDLVAFGRRVLESQPFSVSLGARLDVFRLGHAELTLPVREELLQQHGVIHGGVLAYLADVGAAFAGGSLFGDAVTLELKLNYLKAARGFARLRVIADVIGSGKTQAVCRSDVFGERDEGGERVLCVAAQGTIFARGASS